MPGKGWRVGWEWTAGGKEEQGIFCILTLKSADDIVSDWPAASVLVRNWQRRALSS